MHYVKYAFMCLTLSTVGYGATRNLPPDTGLTTEEQILKYGYPFESHFITTDDGYILRAQRIPYGKIKTSVKPPVVLLMPGIWRSSETWINFGPKRSLGFILADAGFDVWLGNYRGTTWSRRHTRLEPDQDTKKYWDYSLDELGYYDCPAFIDYILQNTGKDSLIYIGETIGAAMFFIMAAEKPAYMAKVDLNIAIAPMTYIGKPTNLIFATISRFKNELQALSDYFGLYEIARHTRWDNKIQTLLCSNIILENICLMIHYIGVGFNPPQFNKTTLPLLLNGFPAGSSVKELIHLSQLYDTGVFAKYDYGKVENLRRYGQLKPPKYNVSGITTPEAIYYAQYDALVEKKAVERFSATLNNVVLLKYLRKFSNGDFFWGIDVVKLVYNGMIELMKKYT